MKLIKSNKILNILKKFNRIFFYLIKTKDHVVKTISIKRNVIQVFKQKIRGINVIIDFNFLLKIYIPFYYYLKDYIIKVIFEIIIEIVFKIIIKVVFKIVIKTIFRIIIEVIFKIVIEAVFIIIKVILKIFINTKKKICF